MVAVVPVLRPVCAAIPFAVGDVPPCMSCARASHCVAPRVRVCVSQQPTPVYVSVMSKPVWEQGFMCLHVCRKSGETFWMLVSLFSLLVLCCDVFLVTRLFVRLNG